MQIGQIKMLIFPQHIPASIQGSLYLILTKSQAKPHFVKIGKNLPRITPGEAVTLTSARV
jgi:hypothetical protein